MLTDSFLMKIEMEYKIIAINTTLDSLIMFLVTSADTQVKK